MAIRKSLTLAASLFFVAALSSCSASLGVFDGEHDYDYEAYYSCFGEVKGLFDGGSFSYDMEDSLFNKTTLESMQWENAGDAVESKQYLYVVLPFETALTIQTVALSVYAEIHVELEMSLFYFADDSQVPTKIKYLTSPETEIIEDVDHNPVEVPIEYDDPPVFLAISHGTKTVSSGSWAGFGFGNFAQQGFTDGKLHTQDGGLLYIRVENNSGWRKDELTPLSFTFINLLIRAV